tara:strand:+ start:1820 stop:1966 length:147 start_codon:yes stop_codon:yes gene_type:complete
MKKSWKKFDSSTIDPELEALFPRLSKSLRHKILQYIDDYRESKEKKSN